MGWGGGHFRDEITSLHGTHIKGTLTWVNSHIQGLNDSFCVLHHIIGVATTIGVILTFCYGACGHRRRWIQVSTLLHQHLKQSQVLPTIPEVLSIPIWHLYSIQADLIQTQISFNVGTRIIQYRHTNISFNIIQWQTHIFDSLYHLIQTHISFNADTNMSFNTDTNTASPSLLLWVRHPQSSLCLLVIYVLCTF